MDIINNGDGKNYEDVNANVIYDTLYNFFRKRIWKHKCYQYTKLHVLDSMISDGNLRATSSMFLNDTAEYNFGNQLLNKDNSNDNFGMATRYFSSSFSKKADNIQQYLMYAGEIGIAVEFDFSFPNWLEKFSSQSLQPTLSVYDVAKHIIPLGLVYQPIEIDYVDESQIDKWFPTILEKISQEFSTSQYKDIVRSLIPCYCKKKGFKAESELRFVVPNYQWNFMIDKNDSQTYAKNCRQWNYFPTRVEFSQADNKLLKPYVNLFFSNESTDEFNKVGLPISSIWIGPGRDQKRAFTSVKMRLEYGKVKMFPLPMTEYIKRLKLYSIYCLGWIYQQYSEIFGKSEWEKAVITDDECLQESKNISSYENRILKKFGKIFNKLDEGINDYEDSLLGVDSDAPKYAILLKEKANGILKRYIMKTIKKKYNDVIIPEMIKYPKKFKNFNIKLNINPKWCEKYTDKILFDFEQFNYFSTIGIAVHCSMKDLSMV